MYESTASRPASAPDRLAAKTPRGALVRRLHNEAGLNLAQIRVVLDLVADHLDQYASSCRDPGVISYSAVATSEPAGKPVRLCRLVAVELPLLCEVDGEVLAAEGAVALRRARLLRLALEAHRQGGPLSYEDLAVVLGIDLSTVKDHVRKLREEGVHVPTRGAVKDIGPEPSHKRIIAEMLARGDSTSRIRAATHHSESSIGRYQRDFALVLHLLHTYPEGSDEIRRGVSALGMKAYETYRDVALKVMRDPDCQRNLERLRKRFELDPDDLANTASSSSRRHKHDPTARLKQQTLPTALRQLIQKDLGTTRRVAEAVTEDLLGLLETSHPFREAIPPGEVVIFTDVHDPDHVAGSKDGDRAVMAAVAPLYTERIRDIWRREEPRGRRRALVATAIASSVASQGGVMSLAGLAELLHCSASTLSGNLRELAVELGERAVTKGFAEDAGPTLTHKDWIVTLDECGLTGEEITWLTRHAPSSRDRYVETHRRVKALQELEGRKPSPELIAKTLGLRLHVATQYADLLAAHTTDTTAEEESGDHQQRAAVG